MEFFRDQASKDVYVSGMNWVVADPFESKHTLISGFILDGAKHAITYKNGSDLNYGLLPDIHDEKLADCRFISLANMAGINPLFKGATVLLMLENGVNQEGTGIAIGMLNGNIVLDCVIDSKNADSKLENFAGLCERSSRAFVLWGNFPHVGKDFDKPFSYSELIANKKNAKRSVLAPLKSNRVFLMVSAAIAAIILIIFVNLTWDWYVQRKKDLVESLRQAQLSPDAQYQTAISAFLAKKHFIANSGAKQIKEQINSIPSSLGGWKLHSIACELPSCVLTWVNAGGSFDGFKSAAPKEWVNITPAVGGSLIGDLKTLTHQLTLSLTPMELPSRSQWLNATELAWKIGNDWQKLSSLGWSGELKLPDLREIPPGVVVAAVRNNPHAVWGINWSVINQPIWLIDGLFEFSPSVVIEKFNVSVDEKNRAVVFGASGIAYVKK